MTRQQLDESLAVRRAVGDAGVIEDTDPSLRRSRLPRVLHDSPAAVLLVEVDGACVVHADPAGRERVLA